VAKSKSGEFYTFDEVLRHLNIDENRLKRLVSEGEIRAFREGDQMKFKRSEIDNLAGKSGRSGPSGDTSLTEISLEEESPTVPGGKKPGSGETLTDDLLQEPDLTKRAGMKTAEISSQDTFIDQGGDVGMSTEPIDFTEEVAGEEAEEISGDVSPTKKKAKAGAAAGGPARRVVVEEGHTPAIWVVLLVAGTLLALCGVFVIMDVTRGGSTSFSRKFADIFYGEEKAAPAPTPPATGG
jgi:excisionase family DNA binding protein